jgi:RNA-directed DNA polymerase
MSKSDKRPKKTKIKEQLELFGDAEKAISQTTSGTSRGDMRAELLSRLRYQRSLTTNLMDKISSYGSLGKAYQQVKRNQGSGGVDGVSISDFGSNLTSELKVLHGQLSEGKYEAKAVRGVEIPKANGGIRRLGIPTIADRVVQQSILTALQPIYDPHFSDYSYGFRPNRSAHQAIAQAAAYVQEGYNWVVDIDLKNFFDEINHDRLMSRLSKVIADKKVLDLIRSYLKAGLMVDGLVSQRIAGSPQGGPLSPLLSNIVLDELDRELEARGLRFVRYADDCNIFVKSERSAHRVMDSLVVYIEEKLKLKVNREKSGVGQCETVKFLGVTIERKGTIRLADANEARFKKKIRSITKRNRGLKFAQIIKEVNLVIQGWGIYFRCCNTWLNTFKNLDGWIRKRLRCYALKQHQRRYATFRFLRSLKVRERLAWNAVLYRSWWPMANYAPVRKAMGIAWFAAQGLKSLFHVQQG